MQTFPIEELIDIDHPADVQLAPDGTYAIFVLGKGYKLAADKVAPKTLYRVDTATGKMSALTDSDTGTNEAPRLSPDGTKLAFFSNRTHHAEMQLYLMPANGGEAQSLTDLRGGIDTPQWLPDGEWISFLYHGSPDLAPRLDPDPIVVDAHPPFKRVWRINIITRELLSISPEATHVFEYAWSPDGTKLALLIAAHPNPAEGWYAAQLHTIALDTGEMKQVCTVTNQMGRLAWSPDGDSLAFVAGVMSDEGNVSGEIYVVAAAGGEPRNITPGTQHSITWITWRNDGIFYGGRSVDSAVIACLGPMTGHCRTISQGPYAINGYGAQQISMANNGTFAALRDSFTEPPNIYVGRIDTGAWTALTHLAAHQEAFPPLHMENRYWQHPDGTRVHGFLLYPPNYTPGNHYPLFLHVHGGPSWGYVPHYLGAWERLMLARGCLVFLPNPRGSWGYGHAYQAANVGDLGGGDWQDINAGVDGLIAEGIVDADRMAIGGWSYGGYLVAWAVSQTTRFRCAIAGASITSYESNYGVVSNREWQTTMFGSNVYDDYELHRSRSPIAFAKQVKTPTLLVHGEKDPLAPVQQAIEFYTALKHFGVPTQLVIYPREPHGFQERAHQIDLHQRVGAWIDRYLFG
jgi:dipeptidyl aminopeptidase/acylaminoacyl peptidase